MAIEMIRCPKCSHRVPISQRYCFNCRYNFGENEKKSKSGIARKEFSNGQLQPETSNDNRKVIDDKTRNVVSSGLIPEGYYPWFLGGVLIGGAVIVPIAIFMLMGGYSKSVIAGYYIDEGVHPGAAWVTGALSSIAFLFCFDKRGNFKWAKAIFAISVATIGLYLYWQHTGHEVYLIGGVAGCVLYSAFGFLGIVIGRLFRFEKRQEKG